MADNGIQPSFRGLDTFLMRTHFLAPLSLTLFLALASPVTLACSCFSPEQRAKTADDALLIATLAVYARITGVDARGNATASVLESFKGPPEGTELAVERDEQACAGSGFTLLENVLLLSFKPSVNACDKYPADHYLIQEFRLKKK